MSNVQISNKTTFVLIIISTNEIRIVFEDISTDKKLQFVNCCKPIPFPPQIEFA